MRGQAVAKQGARRAGQTVKGRDLDAGPARCRACLQDGYLHEADAVVGVELHLDCRRGAD